MVGREAEIELVLRGQKERTLRKSPPSVFCSATTTLSIVASSKQHKMNSPGNERMLTTITDLLKQQEFYSAHQKARTAATRLLTTRSGPASTTFDAKAQDAAYLLWEGSHRLLEQGQVGSGVDLAKYLVDIWSSRGVACGDEERSESFDSVLGLVAARYPCKRRRRAGERESRRASDELRDEASSDGVELVAVAHPLYEHD